MVHHAIRGRATPPTAARRFGRAQGCGRALREDARGALHVPGDVDTVGAGGGGGGEVHRVEIAGFGRELAEELPAALRVAVGVVVHEVAHGGADLDRRRDGVVAVVVAAA